MKIEVARIKEDIHSAERINLGRDHGCFIGVFACRSLLAQTAINDVQQGCNDTGIIMRTYRSLNLGADR